MIMPAPTRRERKRTTEEIVVLEDIEKRLESIFDDYTIYDVPLGLTGILDTALTEISKRKKEIT